MNMNADSDAEFRLGYALTRHIPDMQQRGVHIETSYGELELDERHSQVVARVIKSLIEADLAELRRRSAGEAVAR